MPRPDWQIPRGVSNGVWQYLNRPSIADDYDNYFSGHPLFEVDTRVVVDYCRQHLPADALVADLGCGTGRALFPLLELGYRGLAIDLSSHMLKVVRQKARETGYPVQCLQANLVELDGVQSDSIDAAICLFSTLGMIRGSENRRQAMAHFHRILKPGGAMILHVHNLWFNLRDPLGPWWLIKSWIRSRWNADFESGDKFFDYRGVRKMYLHVFRPSEIRRLISEAGFSIAAWTPLATSPVRELSAPRLFGGFRAFGWIVTAVKDA